MPEKLRIWAPLPASLDYLDRIKGCDSNFEVTV